MKSPARVLSIELRLTRDALTESGKLVVDLLVESGLASSKREAREFLETGAVQVNGERVTLESRIAADSLLHGSFAFIRRGKRNWAVAEFVK